MVVVNVVMSLLKADPPPSIVLATPRNELTLMFVSPSIPQRFNVPDDTTPPTKILCQVGETGDKYRLKHANDKLWLPVNPQLVKPKRPRKDQVVVAVFYSTISSVIGTISIAFGSLYNNKKNSRNISCGCGYLLNTFNLYRFRLQLSLPSLFLQWLLFRTIWR